MKKWLFRIGIVILIIFLALITFVFYSEIDEAFVTGHIKNENLKTVKDDWKGTPLDQKERFVNVEHPFLPSTFELLKWQLSSNKFSEEKKNDKQRLKVLDPTDFLNSEKDGILWLGHASIYIRLKGKTILIDPVFGEPSFVKRFVEVPNPIEKIKQIDYILLSHDHRDHCDETTLKQLADKFPNAKFLGGLRMNELFKDWTINKNETKNAGWYQQFESNDENLKITFVPVRHWSRRGLFDTNYRLWGGFVIESGDTKIYHGGDSGYGSHYKELGETFGEIDYFIVGIGAYEPRWFMKANHNNPADVVRAFQDAKAKFLIPMHYGTFDLSDEPPSQPLSFLKEEAKKANIIEKLKPLQINEYFEIRE